jgi:hypothetical protein
LREIESVGHGTGRHSFRTRLHQQAIDVEPIVLGKRCQSRDGICFFYISTNIEIYIMCQGPAER